MSNAFPFNPVRLSLEIINSIFLHLKDIKDIKALGQVATPFRRPSQRLVFSSVNLCVPDRCPKFYALGQYVLSLVSTFGVYGSSPSEQPPDDLPPIIRRLEHISDLTLVYTCWNAPCHDALWAHASRLTRLCIDSVDLPSLQMLWDLLLSCYETLCDLELRNIRLYSRDVRTAGAATRSESRLGLLTLELQTNDDAYIAHAISGDNSPIGMDKVESLKIVEVAVAWSPQLAKSLAGLYDKISASSAAFERVGMGDLHDLEPKLPMADIKVDIRNMKNIYFEVTIEDAGTASPSMAWWARSFSRSKPRQLGHIAITLRLKNESTRDIQSLFPDKKTHRSWHRLDIHLRCLMPEYVVVRIQMDRRHHSQADFEHMEGWVRRSLVMLDNRGLLYVERDQSDELED